METCVFLSIVAVMPRATYPVPLRRKARLIARGTGTVMYESKTVESNDEARRLAERFLASPRGQRLVFDPDGSIYTTRLDRNKY
jgi:hypothetical protein